METKDTFVSESVNTDSEVVEKEKTTVTEDNTKKKSNKKALIIGAIVAGCLVFAGIALIAIIILAIVLGAGATGILGNNASKIENQYEDVFAQVEYGNLICIDGQYTFTPDYVSNAVYYNNTAGYIVDTYGAMDYMLDSDYSRFEDMLFENYSYEVDVEKEDDEYIVYVTLGNIANYYYLDSAIQAVHSEYISDTSKDVASDALLGFISGDSFGDLLWGAVENVAVDSIFESYDITSGAIATKIIDTYGRSVSAATDSNIYYRQFKFVAEQDANGNYAIPFTLYEYDSYYDEWYEVPYYSANTIYEAATGSLN